MYLDFSKILTNDYSLFITDERLNEIKELAIKERTYLLNKYPVNKTTDLLMRKATEIAYINSRYSMLKNDEKALIASNIVFDDEKFVNILNKGNFDTNCLEIYIKLVNYMKTKFDKNKINEGDRKYLNTIDIYTDKLIKHFSKYVGQVDKHIIINKLNEVLVYNYELLIENKKNKIR